MVPMTPASSPAFLNAEGMARIPEPRHAFSKWSIDPIVLLDIKSNETKLICYVSQKEDEDH